MSKNKHNGYTYSKIMTGLFVIALWKDEDMTTIQFAERVGCSPGGISKILSKPGRYITLEMEQRICEGFRLDADRIAELYHATMTPPITSRYDQTGASKRVRLTFAWVEDIHAWDELEPFLMAVSPLLDKREEQRRAASLGIASGAY